MDKGDQNNPIYPSHVALKRFFERLKKISQQKKKTPPRRQGGKRFFHINKKTLLLLILTLVILFISSTYAYVLKDLPTPEKLSSYDIPQTTKIYDRHEKLLYEIFAGENRTLVKLDQVPTHLRQATIAIEDKDFYRHAGISPIGGILRAGRDMLIHRSLQGGSTITQQLVKTALLSPERTIQRKLKEILLSFWVERLYSKDQILEMYLNHVSYGGTNYGVAAATKSYFNKDIKDLTLAESAVIAGLPAAPTRYSPFGAQPDLALTRQKAVLDRMIEDHAIDAPAGEAAKQQNLTFAEQKLDIKAPHFVMFVKELLVEKYGERLVEQGGLQVTTTLDLDLQEKAQATVSGGVAKLRGFQVGNGAALITRPPTGEILAMVGSRDYFASDSGNFNVTIAKRQPGSAIKPINYAAGLATHKATASTMFLDIPTCFATAGQPRYCPKNYDGNFHGPVQLRFALGNSYNIPAVKMLALNRVETMIATASAMGITTFDDPSRFGLSLTLGGGEVRMTEMAEAFGVFANAGIKKNLTAILSVKDRHGKTLEEFKDSNFSLNLANLKPPSTLLINGDKVLPESVAYIISHILLDNNARQGAFGPSSVLVIPGKHAVSVKTGTTDDYKDNWTIGFTPNFLTAVWIGNNNNLPMKTSGVEGAAPIWHGIMKVVLADQVDLWPKQPSSVVGRQVCELTGTLPSTQPDAQPLSEEQGGCKTRFEYFQEDNLPTPGIGMSKQQLTIDKNTGKQARSDQTDNVDHQEKRVIGDPFSPTYCLDCPHDGDPPTVIDMNKPLLPKPSL